MSANGLGELPDFDPFLEGFFGGVGAPTGKGKEKCEDQKGSIRGIGPKCNLHEEEGALETAQCWYDRTLEYTYVLRDIAFPACQRIQAELLKDAPNEALIEELRQIIEDANKEFDKKIQKLSDDCECKQCSWDLNKPGPDPDDEDDDDEVDPPVDPDTEDNSTIRTVSTGSTYDVIPRVFGRYVTTGNIIWIGNQQSTTINYTQTNTDGTITALEDIVETVDMLVGLAIGPLSRVMRIWIGEALVYNVAVNVDETGQVELSSTDNASSDMNISALLDDSYNMSRLSAFRPTVQFFDGSAGQHVVESMTTEEGFGRVPAHRGLATLLMKDIDLALFGGDMPDIRVDVIANEPESLLPRITATLPGTLQTLDYRAQVVVVADGEDIVFADYVTFDELYRYNGDDTDASLSLVSGATLIQKTAALHVVDAYRDREIDSVALSTIGPGSVAFLAYSASLIPCDYALTVDTDGSFDIVQYDYSNKTLSIAGSVAADVGYDTYDGVMSSVDGILTYYKVSLSTDMETLRISSYVMVGLDSIIDTTPAVTTFDVSLSGPATSCQAILDNNDGNLVIVLDDRFIKLDKDDLTTVWETEVANLPSSIDGLIAINPYYYVVTTNDDIVRVTLEDGVAEIVSNTDTEAGVTLDGNQFYDGNTGSITFDANAGQVARVFPDKIVSAPTSVGAIFDGLLRETTMRYGLFDTSDVQDVTLLGFYIDQPTSIPDVFNMLGELYQVTVVDNGQKLVALKEITITDNETIAADSILEASLHTTRELASERFEVATAQFYGIDDFGLVQINQAVNLRPDVEVTSYLSVDFSLQLYDDPTAVRQRLEKVLLRRIASASKLDVELMPRQLGLTPGDRVTVDGSVYRLGAVLDGAELQSQINGVSYDQTEIETEVELTAAPLYGGLTIAKPTGQLPYEPIILFMNAVNDLDASRSLLDKQVVYTGIDTPHRTNVTPVRFTTRIDPPETIQSTPFIGGAGLVYNPTMGYQSTQAYTSELHSEGVHSGTVTAIPADISTREFETDADSSLVIVFDHPDTVDYFIDGAGILETPSRNLLIVGQEMIQFGDYDVDMDGVTVTFTTLYRGRFGTEPFMNEHTVGEKAYLYTAESLKPMAVDAFYTRARSLARSNIPNLAMIGAQLVPWVRASAPGAAAPYAPSPITRLELDDDPSSAAIRFNLRRSFSVPLLENLGDLPYEWPDDSGEYTVLVAQLQRMPVSMQEWIDAFETHFYTDGTYDDTFIFATSTVQDTDTMSWGYAGTDILDPLVDNFYVAVMQVRSVLDPFGTSFSLLGYPTFRAFRPGGYTDYIPPP
jgi:hypothetical protein